MSSMIIPIGFGGAGASGGKPCIIVAGATKADFAGKSVIVALGGTEIFNNTIPANVQSASFEIEEAGVYTITVGGTAYAVNVSTLNTNYMLIVGDDSTSRPPTVFKTAGTFSYTVPSGVKKLYITGAGGGGGGNYYSPGGGGDACFNKIITVTPGTTYNITVGSGGNGTTSQTGNGSSGGTSKFGSLLTLAGGGGAQYDATNSANFNKLTNTCGAAGGIGSGGFRAIPDYTTNVPSYGNGMRAIPFHIYYTTTSSTTLKGAFDNVAYGGASSSTSLSSHGGGIGAANMYYINTSDSSYNCAPHGFSSLGFGARGYMDTKVGMVHTAQYGGGGCGYKYIDGSGYNTADASVKGTATSTYQKGASGCMIISEEPITWAEMWDLLGEKFWPVPDGTNESGYIVI